MARSIRSRLQISSAIVLMAVVVGFGSLIYLRSKMGRMREIDTRITSAAQSFDGVLRAAPRDFARPLSWEPPPRPPEGNRPPPPPPGPNRERMLNELDVPPTPPNMDPMYFVIWRSDGTILKASKNAGIAAELTLEQLGAGPELQTYFRGPAREVVMLGPRTTVILVGQPLAHFHREMATLTWQLLGSGLLVLLFGVAGAGVIAARIVRPIADISKAASTISATNLSARIDSAKLDTELVALSTVLNDAFGRLEQEFERQARFTADASHELRTPLAIIHANVELALSRPRTPDEYQSTLQTCLESTQRMRSLIDGLLLLARADAGRLSLNRQPLDLADFASAVVARHSFAADQAGVELDCESPDEPVSAMADEPSLTRVLDNLLVNALRHTPRDGRIVVAIGRDGDSAVLTIADSGTGIPADAVPHVFERFFRVDEARARTDGGCGLGLAICRSIVDGHDGTIECESSPGNGSKFTVRLPYCMNEQPVSV